jgi:hypothetical protein
MFLGGLQAHETFGRDDKGLGGAFHDGLPPRGGVLRPDIYFEL